MHPSSFQKFLIVFAAFAAFFNMTTVRAQTTPFEVAAEGLTLSPPSFEMTLKPGEETAHTIQITNPTKNLIELYPSAGNFTADGDGGQPKYEIGTTAIESDSRFSIADWISFYAPKIALLPEQVVEFRFRIKVPENAEPGGHYGVVFLGTKPPEEKDEKSQVALSTMVGSLLLVRVPGDIREEARIEEFSAPWFFWTPPVSFTTFLRNTGNVHIRPQGEAIINDWRGKDIERIDMNPRKGNVLPESRRKFDVVWNPEIKHFWDIPIGKFRATLKVAYGQSDQSLSQEISFWILPKWLLITVGVLLLLCIIVIVIIRRKKRKKRFPPASPSPSSLPRTPLPLRSFPSPPQSALPDQPAHIPPLLGNVSGRPANVSPLSENAPGRPVQPVQYEPSSHPAPPSNAQPEWMSRIAKSNEVVKTTKRQIQL